MTKAKQDLRAEIADQLDLLEELRLREQARQELIAGLDPDFVESMGEDLDHWVNEELEGGTAEVMDNFDYEFPYGDFAMPSSYSSRLLCYF